MNDNEKIHTQTKSGNVLFSTSALDFLFIPTLVVLSPIVLGITISEDFTGAQTKHNWLIPPTGGSLTNASNTVCLTAGDNTNIGNALVAGSPARCQKFNDTPGKGALSLTRVEQYKAGGIISDFTFPTNDGVDINFVTYTYGGSNADGISFFLTDGNELPTLGASGGSLGYSCANSTNKGEGIRGGYLGLGIDEWGNFLNKQDNTNTGGEGDAGVPSWMDRVPGRIGLRGAGSVNYYTLSKNHPTKYPPGLSENAKKMAVGLTCQRGVLLELVSGKSGEHSSHWHTSSTPIMNYPYLKGGSIVLPSSTPIRSDVHARRLAKPISWRLRITPGGLLSLWWSYNGGSYQPILIDKDIVATNGPLPSSFRFGFVGSTGQYTNNHEITCFKAVPATSSDNSASVSLPEGEYKTGAQVYLTTYNPNNWWSSLTSQNMAFSTQTGEITINPQANWDASCILTGGVCNQTGGNTVIAQAPNNRSIFTYSGSQGVAFSWSALNTDQQNTLNAGDNNGQLRLDYLRGDRTNEQKSSGTGIFRKRTSVLGDIINSSPAWVGPPVQYAKQTAWTDKIAGGVMPENDPAAQTYAEFKSNYNDRLNVLYIGANDGFLHGFRSGAYDKEGKEYSPTTAKPNDGKEVLAYMPKIVLQRIYNSTKRNLDFSSPNYAHNYFNDATPGTGDLFYDGKWHTWLVSGLGSGGAAIYALDITDPEGTHKSDKKFTESNANKLVIGEWSHNAEDAVWKHLGNTHGKPEIVRFHNGQWGAVFGNGWCDANDATNGNCKSNTGKAGIYIMLVDQNTGTQSFKFLDTGSNSLSNGIAYVTPVDFDDDNIIDYVYAGDIQGNIWRFDLTNSVPGTWENGNSVHKIFTTPGNQPITTKLSVNFKKGKGDSSANPRVMVNFGTGRKNNGYIIDRNSYSQGTQSVYGIWDSNFASWNSKSTNNKLLSLNVMPSITKLSLTQQTVDSLTHKMSNNDVCWADLSACSDKKSYGWYMNFNTPNSNAPEQVVYNPVVSEEANAMIVNSYVPEQNLTISCTEEQASGYTYAFDIATGKGKKGFWDGKFNEDGYRLPLGATGSPSIIKVNGKLVMLTKDSNGDPDIKRIHLPSEKNAAAKRLSWRIIY